MSNWRGTVAREVLLVPPGITVGARLVGICLKNNRFQLKLQEDLA